MDESASAGAAAPHVPVLLEAVARLLEPTVGETFVDATFGWGGHARAIAERLGPTGRLIALDQDPQAVAAARELTLPCGFDIVHGNFANLESILARLNVERVDGVLADLGVSSWQLDRPERGFSFRHDGPLDMRMDPSGGPTAADLVAQWPERELARIFWEYGEERHSRRVAARIAAERRRQPIVTTGQLASLTRSAVGGFGKIDPATRVFQALRIAVNDELGSLEALLELLPRCLRPGGRAAIVSFHSLEDRRVKHAFRDAAIWETLTRKPVVASEEESAANPRARSAKLRVARRR